MTNSTKGQMPIVHFRKITEEEQARVREYFRENPNERYGDEIWRQTAPEARKVIEAIRAGGFVVGGELEHGTAMDGYGIHSHVYPRGYHGKDVRKDYDYGNVIGSVGIWEHGGFDSNPVRVWYQNMRLVDDSLELRNYLTAQGISFEDGVDVEEIRKRIPRLETEIQDALGLLKKLDGIQLRRD